MKKYLLLVTFSLFMLGLSAQYCGNSGPGICTPSGSVTQPGLSPLPDSLPPFINGVNTATSIQFKNFDTVFLGGSAYIIQALRIDTIDNLPGGLCWATNSVNNTYGNRQNGCIVVSGTPCDTPGQYKMRIIATVTISGGIQIQVDADNYGLKYFVRLNNYGEATVPVDSTQPASNPVIPYGPAPVCTLPLSFNLGPDQTVCNGSVVNFNPVVTGGQTPYTYSWQTTGNSLSCNNCANPSVTLTQNSSFILLVTDGASNTYRDTINYTVTGGGANFQVTAQGATTFCSGGSLVLKVASNNALTYQWQLNGNNINGANDSTYVVTDSSGTYGVYFTASGCHATSNLVNVIINQTPVAHITAIGNTTVCLGTNAVLQADTGLGYTYLWKRDATLLPLTGSSINAAASGSYTLIVTSSGCADTSNAITVTVNPLPTVTLAVNPDTVCIFDGNKTLTGGLPTGGAYSGSGVSGTSFNPVTAGIGAHAIHYSFTDNNGCSNTATDTALVLNCTGIEEINSSAISLYPNPVRDQLTIEVEAVNTSILVYDATGRRMDLNIQRNGNKITIVTNGLVAGQYTVAIKWEGRTLTRSFIKVF